MNKPVKPTKKIIVKHNITYDFDWISKKVSFDGFLAWKKENIPANAKDVTLELVEDWEYDSCFTYLRLEWEQIETNPSYEKELKKYQKKLEKWKKQ